jgi:hypothetical protein
VAERLQAALNEGRLTLSEYDERLEQTYAARTYGDLDRLLDDLPATITGRDSVIPAQPAAPASPAPAAQPDASTGRRGQHWLWAIWGSWLSAVIVCTVIYLLTDLGGYFWPIWVAGPWGALLLLSTFVRREPRGREPGRWAAPRHTRPRGPERSGASWFAGYGLSRVDFPIGAQRPHCHACPALRRADSTAAGADVPRHLRWIL